jgi:hypothetical protein
MMQPATEFARWCAKCWPRPDRKTLLKKINPKLQLDS